MTTPLMRYEIRKQRRPNTTGSGSRTVFNIIRTRDSGATYTWSFTKTALQAFADQIQDTLDVEEEKALAQPHGETHP